MAVELPGFRSTLVAGADLSAAQYTFMKLDASGNAIQCAATTDKPIGVLQNDPKAVGTTGQEAEVMHAGITKITLGGTVAIDDILGTDGAGKAVTYVPGTDTTKYLVGRALESGVSGDIVTMLFSCMAVGGDRGA